MQLGPAVLVPELTRFTNFQNFFPFLYFAETVRRGEWLGRNRIFSSLQEAKEPVLTPKNRSFPGGNSLNKRELEPGGISVHQEVKTMDKAGPSVSSKKRNRGCPSSGLSEQDREMDHFTRFSAEMMSMDDCIEMDDSTSFSTEMKPMNDFIEMDDLTSCSTGMKLMDDFIETDDFTSLSTEMKLMDDFIETDDFTSLSTEMKPMDDFIEMDDLTSFRTGMKPMDDITSLSTEMFGSLFDGQIPTLGGEEAIVNESPHYKNVRLRLQNIKEATTNEHVNQDATNDIVNQDAMPMDDFIEMDDFTSFCIKMMPMDDFTGFNTELMPMDDFIEMDDFTSFSTEMVQWEDYNDQSSLVHQYYSLNKLEN
ncbi:hypothetical protein SLE2022_017070 [Rubroshorea leprosula]